MYKILTQKGILRTSSEQTAKTIAINAAKSGEIAVLAGTTGEYVVRSETRGSVVAYSVKDMWEKGNESLISAYRNVCFSAYAAEERKAQKAACTESPKTTKAQDSDLLKGIFDQFFGDLVSPKK